MTAAKPCEHGLPISKCKPCTLAQRRAIETEKRRAAGVQEKVIAICAHGMTRYHCRECRNARSAELRRIKRRLSPDFKDPNGKICEHGVAVSKCKICYREILLKRAKAYNARESTKERQRAWSKVERKRNVEKHRARDAMRYALDPDRTPNGERQPICCGYATNKQKYRKLLWLHQKAVKWAYRNNVPYSLFVRCKTCNRSTPNVNNYCDDHQDVYNAMQQAVELYRLTKELRRGIHHVRYQD